MAWTACQRSLSARAWLQHVALPVLQTELLHRSTRASMLATCGPHLDGDPAKPRAHARHVGVDRELAPVQAHEHHAPAAQHVCAEHAGACCSALRAWQAQLQGLDAVLLWLLEGWTAACTHPVLLLPRPGTPFR